jgi:hypothetical protein
MSDMSAIRRPVLTFRERNLWLGLNFAVSRYYQGEDSATLYRIWPEVNYPNLVQRPERDGIHGVPRSFRRTR